MWCLRTNSSDYVKEVLGVVKYRSRGDRILGQSIGLECNLVLMSSQSDNIALNLTHLYLDKCNL